MWAAGILDCSFFASFNSQWFVESSAKHLSVSTPGKKRAYCDDGFRNLPQLYGLVGKIWWIEEIMVWIILWSLV